MGIADDVEDGAADLLATPWSVREGKVVPRTEDVALKGGAVRIEATYLYADMAGSSKLAQGATEKQTAKIIRLYL